MTNEEKVPKYDEIRNQLWWMAVEGGLAQSTIAATLIRLLKIEGPNGEDPDDA